MDDRWNGPTTETCDMAKKPKKQAATTERTVEVTAEDEQNEELVTRRDLQDWMDRWTDSIGTHLPGLFGNRLPEMWGSGRELGGVIKIEETMSDDGIDLRCEMPGVDPDRDIEIVVDNGRLVIRAERRESTETTEGSSTRSEFRYGSYRRSVELPPGASADDIVASYENGILDVRIPIDEEHPEPKRISIEAG